MAKRPTRLRFTEDDLSSDAVKKAAGKAEKAAAKAEKAVDKITPKKHRKLRQEADVSASRTAKLRFGKAKADDIPPKPSGIKRTATHAPVDTLSANVHKSISRYEDDNVGVQTAHQTELGAETAYHVADHAVYSHKLKAYDKAEKLVSKSDKANVNALFEKFKKDNPNASSNPLSRWQQKHNIKKEYAAARAGKGGKATAKGAEKTAKGAKSLTQKITDFCVSHKTALLWVLAIGLLFMVIDLVVELRLKFRVYIWGKTMGNFQEWYRCGFLIVFYCRRQDIIPTQYDSYPYCPQQVTRYSLI